MSFLSLLLTFLCASITTSHAAVIPDNPVTLQLSRLVNERGILNLVAHDLARAKAMIGHGKGLNQPSQGADSSPLINQAVAFVATVDVGSSSTPYKLLVDTGSSNTWVGADAPYVPSSTSSKTSNKVSVTYGSGSFSGDEWIDQVSLTSNLVIPQQSIGVASTASGFANVDGILGVGPVGLTVGTLSPDTEATIPTVTDNLYANKNIRHNEIGVYFQPSPGPGELTWGGVNSEKICGEITYTPITATSPASKYWGVDQGIEYGTDTNILPTAAGIVDTGTTLILIATDAYERYMTATGAVYDSTVGLLSVTPDQYDNMKSLYFVVEGVRMELIPNAQIWPRSLNTDIGGKADAIYLIVSDLGTPSGQGLDFINGLTFLQRYYTVYDTANARVGFAATPNTMDQTN